MWYQRDDMSTNSMLRDVMSFATGMMGVGNVDAAMVCVVVVDSQSVVQCQHYQAPMLADEPRP
jgi:hypothetical protein